MILCLDYGERYVGVAITDYDERLALRHSVIDQKKTDVFVVVKQLAGKEKVTKVLVGVPVSLSGRETQQTQVSLVFMQKLCEMLGSDVNVEGVDETLTSVEARQRIKVEGGKLEDEHTEAARLMLVDYLAKRQSGRQDT